MKAPTARATIDARFYAGLFPELKGRSAAEILDHWRKVGEPRQLPGSKAQLLSRGGFEDAAWVDEVFDFTLYKRLNFDIAARLRNEVVALCHFVLSGLKEGRQLSEEEPFDAAFYTSYYRDVRKLAPAQAYFHWLERGRKEGRLGSPIQFWRRFGLSGVDLPETFTLETYLSFNPDLGGQLSDRWRAIEHFLQSGSAEGRDSGLAPADQARILRGAARGFRKLGEKAKAVAALQRSLAADASIAWAFEELGNCHLDLGRPFDALEAYDRAAALGGASAWGDVNAGNAAAQLGLVDAALLRARRSVAARPGWIVAEDACRRAVQGKFDRLMARARVAVLHGDRDLALALAGEAAELSVQVAERPRVSRGTAVGERRLRVVTLVNDGLRQCYHYRVLQKLQQLSGRDDVVWQVFPMADVQEFRSALAEAGIALFYRVPATPEISAAIGYASSLGLPTVYEIDDLIFAADHYPPPLPSYGGLVDPLEYSGLTTGVPLFRAAMAQCDYALASTPSLARHMRSVVKRGESFVHRNALGTQRTRRRSGRPPRESGADHPLRIFYGSGTKAHNSDFEMLAMPALLRLLRERPEIELVVVGHLELPPAFDPFADRIRRTEVLDDHEVYWSLLKDADINIAVLEPGAMNDCKSEIKWLEAAALHVPSVVSDTATYREILTEGETVLFAADPDGWYRQLDRLAADAGLRRSIAEKAHAQAVRDYSPPVMAGALAGWLHDIAERQPVAPASRLKVLVVNVFFPPQTIGGATRVMRDNVDLMIDKHGDEFELSVFTTYDGHPTPYLVDRYDYRGIPVTRVSTPQEVDMDWRWQNERVGEIFAAHLARTAPDVIHFHCVQRLTGSVVQAARDAGIPYVITAHDAWWISDFQFLVDDRDVLRLPHAGGGRGAVNENRNLSVSLRRLLDLRESLDNAEAVLAVSDSFAEIYRRSGIDHVRSLPNGLSRIEWLPRTVSTSGRVRLGHIGGMSTHKGFHLVREVLRFGRFDRLELTMVDHAQAHGSVSHELWGATPVRIVGKVPQEEIASLYADLDVLLSPSIWPESYGLVVREALAAGLWAVTSDLGALGEPVEDGVNGFKVGVDDAKPLYDVLAAMNADPERFRRSPPQLARWTSQEDQVRGLVEIYREIAAAPRETEWNDVEERDAESRVTGEAERQRARA